MSKVAGFTAGELEKLGSPPKISRKSVSRTRSVAGPSKSHPSPYGGSVFTASTGIRKVGGAANAAAGGEANS